MRTEAPSRTNAAVINLLANWTTAGFTAITGLLLVPFYLRHFDMALYGAWIATLGVVGMLGLCEGGLNLVFTQRLARCAGLDDNDGFAAETGTGIAIAIGMIACLPASAWVIAPYLPNLIACPPSSAEQLKIALVVASTAAAATMIASTISSLCQAWQLAAPLAVAGMTANLVGVVVTVLGVHLGYKVVALAVGQSARAIASVALLLGSAIREWRRRDLPSPSFECARAKLILATVARTFASKAAATVGMNSQTLVIAMAIGVEAAAIYSISVKLFDFAAMLVPPISMASFAGFAHVVASEPQEKALSILTRGAAVVALTSAVLMSVSLAINKPFVTLWVGPEKHAGIGLAVAYACMLCVRLRLSYFSSMLGAAGHLSGIARRTLWEPALKLAFAALTIHAVGWLAVPLAEVVSQLVVVAPAVVKHLSAQFSMSPRIAVHLLARGVETDFAALGAGALAAIFLRPLSWSALVATAAVVGAVTLSSVLLIDERTKIAWNETRRAVFASLRRR